MMVIMVFTTKYGSK